MLQQKDKQTKSRYKEQIPVKIINQAHTVLNSKFVPSLPVLEYMVDAKYYAGAFKGSDLEMLTEFSEWCKGVGDKLGELCYTNSKRGHYKTFALGAWQQQGHNSVHYTPLTLTSDGYNSTKRFCKIWDICSSAVISDFPLYASNLLAVPEQWRLLGLWIIGIVNLGQANILHTDTNDEDFCVIVPLSDFSGGHLAIPSLGLEFQLSKGDFLIFRSKTLPHYVTKVLSGLRCCVVLTAHSRVIKLLV